MKLLQIREDGHWAVLPDYPGSTVKSKKNKKEQMSLFVDPKQRDEYIKKMKMDKNVEIEQVVKKYRAHTNLMAEWGIKNGISAKMLSEAVRTADPNVSDLWGQHLGSKQLKQKQQNISNNREINKEQPEEQEIKKQKSKKKTAIEDWPIEKKYVAVADWVTNLFERLADKGKGALGKKPKWMIQDGDMHKLLGAIIQELENEMKVISAKANAHLQKIGR